MRTPVSSASRPCTICRKSGTVKKMPISTRFWASSIATPPRSEGSRRSRRWTSGSRPCSSRRRSQAKKAASTIAPAAITNGVSENPNGSSGELRGLSQPQLLAWITPKTKAPSPSAERTEPTQSRPEDSVGGGSSTRREPNRIPIATTTSPAKTTRQLSSVVAQPPRIGPTAIPAPATPPSTP